jgi:hypothetical protein
MYEYAEDTVTVRKEWAPETHEFFPLNAKEVALMHIPVIQNSHF